jgi:hypothetical protein
MKLIVRLNQMFLMLVLAAFVAMAQTAAKPAEKQPEKL